MIKPDKYTNLDLSVLNIGGMVLRSLKNCSVQKYEDLEDYIVTNVGDSAKPVFVVALSFLYCVGRITYHSSSDTIKLVQL